MPQFRKKPVVIEAWQYTTESMRRFGLPDFVRLSTDVRFSSDEWDRSCAYIKTLEGEMRADQDDWIIKGVKGEIYPCKPDIFEATYDPVTADDDRRGESAGDAGA